MKLLDNSTLEQSSVVANSAMNRERKVVGANSYTKELNFNPLLFLKERLQHQSQVAWLDLCCGSGRAAIEAARDLYDCALADRARVVGIDLVSLFRDYPLQLYNLELRQESLSQWNCDREYDLITCVHGLHYVGNKLRIIQEAVAGLTVDGMFLAHLDPDNLKFGDGQPAGRKIIAALRHSDFTYNPRKHLLSCQGKTLLQFTCSYLGSNDQAGSNYTGQPAVDSYYAFR